jgi:hypothetical protein
MLQTLGNANKLAFATHPKKNGYWIRFQESGREVKPYGDEHLAVDFRERTVLLE